MTDKVFQEAGRRCVQGLGAFVGTDDAEYAGQIEERFAKQAEKELRSRVVEREMELTGVVWDVVNSLERNPRSFGSTPELETLYLHLLETILCMQGTPYEAARERVQLACLTEIRALGGTSWETHLRVETHSLDELIQALKAVRILLFPAAIPSVFSVPPDNTPCKVIAGIGLTYDFSDLRILRKYIADGRVTPEDLFSWEGESWQRIGDIVDFKAYFIPGKT